jgi:ribonucleoside-diphosphate reductase alpha chain
MKKLNFNYAAPLDMMNVSLNYDDAWLKNGMSDVFMENCRQAMMTGEPGFSFNFGEKQNETLRNACTEITSEDDSDVCNLGSVNLANIESIEELRDVVNLASKFLVCGLIRAHLPYEKVEKVRQQNSRIGLGLMGMHEWLLKRGYRYEFTDELKTWMKVYEQESTRAANEHCDRLFLNRPKGYRAIAPTGTISILSGTTSGVEPIYAVAYRRRYLTEGTRWKYQFVVDGTAEQLIKEGISPDSIESAVDLAEDFERRIKFQHELQKYVDHAISSTINLPAWGTEFNNEDRVKEFARIVRKYAPGLRGLTIYPDGSRGGQPIASVPYEEAHSKRGVVFEDNSEEQCLSGVCGI